MTIGKDKNQIFVDGNDTNLFNKLTQEINVRCSLNIIVEKSFIFLPKR